MSHPHRYALRPTANGQHIDIVQEGASRGAGYEVRIPVRDGRARHAGFMASLIRNLLNEYAAAAHQDATHNGGQP